MDAHVDEGAEVDDVAHRAPELHAGLKILDGERGSAEDHLGGVVSRVAAGLLELVDDVDEGGGSAAEVARERSDAAHAALDVGDPAALELVGGDARALEDLGCHGVALGVDARGVKRVVTPGDAQEAGRVEVCLGPELGDLLELAPIGEGAVLLAVCDDVVGDRGGDARDVAQKARARGVHVHADSVDHVLDDVAERAGELRLVKVVLILTHAYGLGRDLDELGERVLQAPA